MSKQAKVDVIINNEQAKARLAEIQKELSDIKKMKDKAMGDGDTKAFNQLNAEFKKLTSEAKQYERKVIDINEVLKNLSSASIREMQNALQQANREMNAMKRNDPGWGEKKKQVMSLKNELNSATNEMKVHQSGFSRLADGANKYFAVLTAGAATLAGFVMGLRSAVDVSNLFEERVDNLSALTGLVGEDLDWLSKEAKKLSTSVIEGNVRIKASATEIVDAYTKVGSKRPELLLIKEDLNAVTQEAMILASAAKSDLQPAVDGLTMVLNQFNAPASESRKIINILAAGSKVGAGEIDYLTAGFEKSGSVASSFGVSVEELTGVLETLAPRISAPEMAGRSLRNIMIKLETQSNDKLKPSLVGLGKAFEYLYEQQWSVTQLNDLFGTENINAANILMNNTAETKKYTEAVTGTNIALEQAAINTDNNATKLQQAKNKVEVLTIEFGQKLAPAMTFSTNAFAYFMKAMMAAPAFIKQNQILLISLAGALLAYNGVIIKNTAVNILNNILLKEGIGLRVKEAIVTRYQAASLQLSTIWKTNESVATKLAATTQWAWNAAIAANPISAIILGITALVVAIKMYDKYGVDATRLEKEKAEAMLIVTKVSDTLAKSYESNAIAIGQLNKLSAAQKAALLETIDATLKQAEAELILLDVRKKKIQDDAKPKLWQKLVNSLSPATYVVNNAVDAIDNGIEATEKLSEGIKSIRDQIKQLKDQKGDLSEIVNAEKIADLITGKAITQLEEKQRYLTTALKNYEKGSADYIRIAKKLSTVNKQLEADNNDGSGKAEALKDAFEQLNSQIKEIDAKINDAIASGNTPLAEKLTIEKKAADKLLEAYKKLKEAVAQGWDLTQRDQGTIEKLVSIGKAVVKDDSKKKPVSPFKKRDSTQATGPSDDIKDAELADEKMRKDIKDASLEGATILSDTLYNIKRNQQQAEFDHKMSLLEKEKEKELSNKNLTEEQKAAINTKYAKKEAALKTEQFKKQQNADVLQTIINGVLSVAKTFAQLGYPAGIPAAVISAAATIAQVAVIKSQKPPEFYEGGFGPTDINDKKPVGMFHANEFIGSAKAVRNPSVKKIFDIIDYAQKSGTISQINLPAVIASASYPGKQSGGYASDTTAAPAGNMGASTSSAPDMELERGKIESNNRLSSAIERMLDEGVKGKWSLFDLEKIQKDKSAIQAATDL